MVPAVLGYRGEPGWRDMSEYAVHFTKDVASVAPGQPTVTAYDSMLSILASGELRPGHPVGAARKVWALGDSQACVCFSEIPLDRLDRLVNRRSAYGIAFKQSVLIDRGGGRVWYVDKNSALANAVAEVVRSKAVSGMNVDDDYWRLTPFIDFPGEYGDTQYRFEWEREWRVPGVMTFQPSDVAFLFLPETFHSAARAYFAEVEQEHRGPAYLCPYIDPFWDEQRLQQWFASVQV